MIDTKPDTPLSSSPYPSHVLLQFILVESLHTQNAFAKLNSASIDVHLERGSKVSLEKLLHITEGLVGAIAPFRNNFSWNRSHGTLTKLKNDTQLLHCCYADEVQEAAMAKKLSAKAWLLATELRDITIQMLWASSTYDENAMRFQKVQKKLAIALKKLGAIIAKVITSFAKNENILFCLIDRHKQIDSVYGNAFTLRLLKKMSLTIDTTLSLLIDAYQKRGFETFIPKISAKINSMRQMQ